MVLNIHIIRIQLLKPKFVFNFAKFCMEFYPLSQENHKCVYQKSEPGCVRKG